MDSALWKILGFLLAAVLLFLVPMMSILERQDDVAYSVVFTEVNRFADSARDTGYITPAMYNDFVSRLGSTGNTFDITLRHVRSIINPVYEYNGTGYSAVEGQFEIIRISVSETEILATLFPNDGKSALDPSHRYKMKEGDLLFVEVKNKGKTMATALRDMMLFSDSRTPALFVRAGGLVRNEAY